MPKNRVNYRRETTSVSISAALVMRFHQIKKRNLGKHTRRPWMDTEPQVNSHRLTYEFIEHTDTVNDAIYIPDIDVFASASDDSTVKVYYKDVGKIYSCQSTINTSAKATALAYDSKRGNIVIGLDNGLMLLITVDISRKAVRLTHQLDAHKGRIASIIYNAERDAIISVGKDKQVRFYYPAKRAIHGAKFRKAAILEVAYDSRYDRVFCATYDKKVPVGRLDPSESKVKTLEELTGHTQSVRALCFDQEGQMLYTGSFDRTVAAWDTSQVDKAIPVRQFKGHSGKVKGVALDEERGMIYSTGDDQTVREWVATTGECRQVWQVASSPLLGCRYYGELGVLLTWGKDKVVRGWKVLPDETDEVPVVKTLQERAKPAVVSVHTEGDAEFDAGDIAGVDDGVAAIPLGVHDLMDEDDTGL